MKQILLTLLSFGVLFPGITHYLNAQISVSHDSILLDHLSNMASSKDTSYFSDTIIPPYLTTFPAFFRDNEYHPGVEDTTFFDKYAIRTGRKIHGDNYFKVNRFTYELGKDYFPLPQTGNGEVKSKLIDVNFGINAPSLDYNDYEEFKARELKDNAFLIRLSTPDGYNQRSPFKKYAKVEAKSQEAIKRGASAVVFSNLDPNLPDPEFAINTIKDTFDVPILYLKEKHYRKLEYDYDYQTILQVSLKEIRQYGKSFLATKNVGASKTLLVISTYQPNDTIKNSNQQKNSSQKSAMSSFKEWGYRFAQDTSNSLNYMFALLPNDRTFDKGWKRLQDVIFNRYNSRTFYLLALDMPSSFGSLQGKLSMNEIKPNWEAAVTRTDSNISFENRAENLNIEANACYDTSQLPILHLQPTDSNRSLLQLTKTGINYANQLIHKPAIPDTLEKQASAVHRLFIPDYSYRDKGLRLYTVRNQKLVSNNILPGHVITKLNGKEIDNGITFYKRLGEISPQEKITLTFQKQDESHSIKIDHPLGADS